MPFALPAPKTPLGKSQIEKQGQGISIQVPACKGMLCVTNETKNMCCLGIFKSRAVASLSAVVSAERKLGLWQQFPWLGTVGLRYSKLSVDFTIGCFLSNVNTTRVISVNYTLKCQTQSDFGKVTMKFELEVCQLSKPEVVGIRRQRLKGDAWVYKRLMDDILSSCQV
uniref:non-specific serine/threonine protein kinase n=1 Tax=Anas platyrhynchos platyrhynchos TaxID=8840 RepID=A0A493TDH8_ANAPP